MKKLPGPLAKLKILYLFLEARAAKGDWDEEVSACEEQCENAEGWRGRGREGGREGERQRQTRQKNSGTERGRRKGERWSVRALKW